jgi:hypothetical protein
MHGFALPEQISIYMLHRPMFSVALSKHFGQSKMGASSYSLPPSASQKDV